MFVCVCWWLFLWRAQHHVSGGLMCQHGHLYPAVGELHLRLLHDLLHRNTVQWPWVQKTTRNTWCHTCATERTKASQSKANLQWGLRVMAGEMWSVISTVGPTVMSRLMTQRLRYIFNSLWAVPHTTIVYCHINHLYCRTLITQIHCSLGLPVFCTCFSFHVNQLFPLFITITKYHHHHSSVF